MKKYWNEMSTLDKVVTMVSCLMVIAGYAAMFYSFMLTVGMWLTSNLHTIHNMNKSLRRRIDHIKESMRPMSTNS